MKTVKPRKPAEQKPGEVLRRHNAPQPAEARAKRGPGRPAKSEDMVRLVVLLPPELKAKLERRAADMSEVARRQVTLSRIVADALAAHLGG